VGGNLGQLADDNGWAGILVDGCVRDVGELRGTTIGIRARGSSPRRSVKLGAGERDMPVTVGGVAVSPGMWLWADGDGIVVSDQNLEG
jgi:regulator of ribonuclease activity A